MKTVTIIVPLYNEEEMFPLFLEKARTLFVDDDRYAYELLFVNDGSSDKTLELLKSAAGKANNISYISFSRNFSQEAALAAGLKASRGDYVIPMDCDFQDPPELVRAMCAKADEGYDIVCPKRRRRDGDTAAKKFLAVQFYKFINRISGREVIADNVSYFRLMTRRVVEAICSLPETERLFKSEAGYVGFKVAYIDFDRPERAAGHTKYNYRKLFRLAARTVTSSTTALLYLPLKIGIAITALGGLGFLTCLILHLMASFGNFFLGAAATINLWLIIAAIVLGIGILTLVIAIPCLYLQNLVVNVQQRPLYIVDESYECPLKTGSGN